MIIRDVSADETVSNTGSRFNFRALLANSSIVFQCPLCEAVVI